MNKRKIYDLDKVYKHEDVLQADCWQMTWDEYPQTRRTCFHVPNGGARTKVQAAQFTGMGVIAGVSDMHFIWQSRYYIIELKVGANFITDRQEQFIRAATKQGAIFYECRSLRKWHEIITRILNENPLPCEAHRLISIKEGEWFVTA